MKKFLLALAILLLTSSWVFGTMDCVFTSEQNVGYTADGGLLQETLYTCTMDAVPLCGGASCSDTLTAAEMAHIGGKYGYTLITKNGTTGPTDNSDIAITDSRGVNFITSTGNGANIIDNAATNQEYFEGPNGDQYPFINASYPWTITIHNDAVANSSVLLYVQTAK